MNRVQMANSSYRQKPNSTFWRTNTAYRLIETTPPIGYLMDENPQIINFYYSEGDESKFINKPEGYKGYNLAIEEHEIPVSNEKYHELKLRKVDSETGQPLDQTEFTLQVWDSVTNKYKDYLKSDNQVLKFYSDKDGEIQISSNRDFKFLKNQAYRLIETGAKDGYILPADPPVIEFFYGGGSEGISKPDNFNGVDLSKEEQTVTIKNVKNRNLSILKVDSEDPAKTIKDTEFTLSKFEKGVYSKVTDGNGNTITFKTNQNGQIQITEYIKDKNFIFSDKVLYILEETKANPEYMLPEDNKLLFVWGNELNKEIQLPGDIDPEQIILIQSDENLTITNKKRHTLKIIKINGESKKKDDNGNDIEPEKLQNANFTLYKWDPVLEEYIETKKKYTTQYKTGEAQIQWQASGEDYPFESNLAYCLKETKAPDGFSLPDEPEEIEFYFSSEGQPVNGPKGHTLIDLNLNDETRVIENFKKSLLVKKKWIKNGQPINPQQTEITVDLYRQKAFSFNCWSYSKGFTGKVPEGGTVTFKSELIQTDFKTEYLKVENVEPFIETDSNEKKYLVYRFDNVSKDFSISRPYVCGDQFEVTIDPPENLTPFKSGIILNSNNNWQYRFTEVDLGPSDGTNYLYYVRENNDLGTNHYQLDVSYKNSEGIIVDKNVSVTITNTYIDTGVELPETGGSGVRLVRCYGLLISSIAAGLLVSNRKRKRK